MKMMRTTLLLWMLAVLVALPGLARAQSLAGAARAAEEQRQEVGETPEGRVFTNGSLRDEAPPAVPPRLAPNPALTAGAAAEGEDGEAAEADDADGDEAAVDTSSEEYWRQRIADARASLTESQAELATLQTDVNRLTADFTATDDPIQRQQVFNDRQVALADLNAKQDEVTATQQQIAAIQEEARRAGVPAGWVR